MLITRGPYIQGGNSSHRQEKPLFCISAEGVWATFRPRERFLSHVFYLAPLNEAGMLQAGWLIRTGMGAFVDLHPYDFDSPHELRRSRLVAEGGHQITSTSCT
jgi:hypothetical protein